MKQEPDKYAFATDKNIVAAVSGGADSAAMLHILCHSQINSEPPLNIICAHINHQLRGTDSDEDERFVHALSEQYQIPFYSQRIDVKGYAKTYRLSIETAARKLRIDALEQLARQSGCTAIATAHHKDDQSETLLMRLRRGTAFAGLAGIHPVTERHGIRWIRPLLQMRRTEIEQYCRTNNLDWREDKTNRSLEHTRNWVRHRLLPYIQNQSQTDITESMCRLADAACRMQMRLDNAIKIMWQQALTNYDKRFIRFDISRISEIPPLLAGELLRRIYSELACGQRDLAERHYQRYFQLLNSSKNSSLEFPGGCRIQKYGTSITFEKISQKPAMEPVSVNIPLPGVIYAGNWLIRSEIFTPNAGQCEQFLSQHTAYCEWFDIKQLTMPVIARSCEPDDYFLPFGAKEPKHVGNFLSRSKTDPSLRKQALIIDSPSGILWLTPIRRSAIAAINKHTKQILSLSVQLNLSDQSLNF